MGKFLYNLGMGQSLSMTPGSDTTKEKMNISDCIKKQGLFMEKPNENTKPKKRHKQSHKRKGTSGNNICKPRELITLTQNFQKLERPVAH